MGEQIRPEIARARLRALSGGAAGNGRANGPRSWEPQWRLISAANVAISKDLQGQTQAVLATLTPREAQVLRMRFGIGQQTYQSVEQVRRRLTITRAEALQIEAQALRKLRRPQVQRLRDVSRLCKPLTGP